MSNENNKISKIKLGNSVYDIGANWENISNKPDLSLYAPKVSPALTGVPTAPTASAGTNTTQIATTAFVNSAVDSAKSTSLAGYGITDAYTKTEINQLLYTVTPENYGAAGDGATDDTAAVQNAIDYSIAHKVPFRGKTGAVYLISKPIQIVMSESGAFYGAFDFDGSTIKTTDTFSDNFKNICLVMNRKPNDWESAYSNYYKSENGQFVPVTLVSKVVDGETTYVVPGFSSDTFYAKRSCALLICISARGHWQKHAKTSIKNLVIDGNRESVHTGIMVERTEGFIFENINIYDTRRGIYLSDTCTETMIRKCTARRSNYSGITYDLDLYNQISNNQLNLDGAFPESDRSEELLDGRINLLKTQCVGFEMNTADAFIQDCVAIDYVIGVKIMAGDNKVYGCHIWNTMLNQLRSDCCFMQSSGNYFVNNTCDHFYIGIYTLYSMPSYFVNTLFTSNSLSGNDFSNDINYCWYLGQYASRSKGCDITVIGTNIHSNLKNLNTSKRLLAWCNVDRPAFRDVGTKGYGIIGYQPAEDGTVNYKKLEVDNNGVIPMLPECAETEYGTRPQDYNDETGIIIGEGGRLGIIRTAGCRLKMKIDDNGKHTFQMLPSPRENPPSIMSVYIGYKDDMDYMEEGHDYILKFRYKNNNSKALLSLNHTEKAVAQHGDLPALIPKMSNADETSLPSFRRYLAYDGEEHSAYCMFKFRKDLTETVTENGENVTYLRKVFPSIRIAASDFSVDSELIISDIRLFDITDLPRYFLETRWAYLNRISDFIGSAADDVDTSRSSDISFVATEYPVDIDYEPNNKWGDYYKIRYDDVGRPLVSALTAETGGNEAANYALIPVNSKLIFDAIIYHSSNESNSIYLSDSLSQKQKGYSITSKPQPSPVAFEREDSPVKLLLKNSTLQNKKILSFRIGSKLECDAPVTDNGGFVPTFSTGKVYLVKKNSAETETLPTVKIKEAYAKAGGKDGKSAYEIAVEHGYQGTEEQWLASLKGVSVKDFGAKGDGETDDTAAIKQAIEENNFVIFPEGEYLTNGVSVANLSDRTLWARGAEVKFNGNGGSVFHFANCDNINIVGGSYKGMNKAKYGLSFVDSKNVRLDGVSVQNVGNSDTAGASGINFVGDCSYSKLNDVYIDGVTSGQSDGSYIFAHGIGFTRSSTTGHYSKYVEINHPVIKNVGYVNGENYVNATAEKDSDGEITGYMVGNNACKADIIEEIDGEYHARIDGDGIFLVQSKWGNVHDGIESYFKINNVDISRCSKRALKIAARCVDVDGGEIDVATWSAAVEVQRVRNNSLRNLNITDTTYTPVTINGGDGPMAIENCRITGGGMSSNGSGGIVLGAKSTGLIEGSEIVHIKNCVFDNVRFPIYAAIDSAAAGKTDCEELVIKDCLIKHFYGDAAVKLEAGRYQRLGKLIIDNVSFAYGTSTATVFFNNNNFYERGENQSVPLNSRLFDFFSPEKTVKVMCDNLSDDFREIFESYNLTTPNQIFEMPLQPDVIFTNPDEQVKLTSGDYDSDGGSEFKASAAGNTVLLSETSGETYAKGQRVVVPLESPVTVSPGERLFLTIYNSHPRTSSVNDLTVNFFTNLGATEGALSAHDENYGISSGYTAYVKKRAYELSLDQSLTLQTMVIRVNAATTITEGTEITVSLKTEKGLKEIYTKAETEQLITHSASLKESLSNKVQSIGSQSQTGDNDKYPSVTAVRNYVNTKTDELDEAKADKADYTSVKDFGAKGDGITNDTAAFNTAIAAKRFIFIPAGTYLIDDITVDKSVSIKGAGITATYLKANSETSGGSLITIIKNRSSISDMSIHGRNGSNVNHAAITVAPHAGTEPNSIAATTTITLENLKIQGMAGIGINILDNVEDCVISNVNIESCKSSGMKLWGVGHSISNVTSQKNKGDGIEIRQGGLHMTNVRCWGNEGNGMSMGGVSHAVISNVELQQNQLNGLYMVPVDNSGRRNRMNSIINVTTLGNNYKKVGNNDEPGSALTENTCGFVVSGLYNYVQGFDVLSKFMSGWIACEKYSLLMSQPDDIGNTVDIKTAAGNGIDMYNVMFSSKYSRRIFEEPHKAKIAFNNPFNKIIIDGSAVEPPAMTASVHQSESDVVHSNVSASVTNNGKSVTLSGLTSAGVTVVDFNNFYNHSFPYRQIHKINYTSGTKRVYIRLRARVSDFRKFGIVPGLGQIINQNGTNIGTTYRLGSEDLKKNCIFNTDFTTKEFYFEIPDTTLSLGSFLVKLHFVKLTDDEIDEVSFEIDELSAAFLDETPTVIGNIGNHGQDSVLTNQDKSDIADIVLGELPTTEGVLYGNTNN